MLTRDICCCQRVQSICLIFAKFSGSEERENKESIEEMNDYLQYRYLLKTWTSMINLVRFCLLAESVASSKLGKVHQVNQVYQVLRIYTHRVHACI